MHKKNMEKYGKIINYSLRPEGLTFELHAKPRTEP